MHQRKKRAVCPVGAWLERILLDTIPVCCCWQAGAGGNTGPSTAVVVTNERDNLKQAMCHDGDGDDQSLLPYRCQVQPHVRQTLVTMRKVTCLSGMYRHRSLPRLSKRICSLLVAPGAGEQLTSVLPIRVLQAQLTINPLSFCTGCCRLSEHLGLQLPPVAGEALLLRGVMDLGLPMVSVVDTVDDALPRLKQAGSGQCLGQCA